MIDADKEKRACATLSSEKVHGTLEKPEDINSSQSIIQSTFESNHGMMKENLPGVINGAADKSSNGILNYILKCPHLIRFQIEFKNSSYPLY